MQDRRIFERIKTRMPLDFIDLQTGSKGEAESLNISASGLSFLTSERLEVSALLEIWLHIPDNRPSFYMRAEVVWAEESECKTKQRIGVRLEKTELFGLARALWVQRQ